MGRRLCIVGFSYLSFLTVVIDGGTSCEFYIFKHDYLGNKYCESGACCNSDTVDPCCHGNNSYESFSSSLSTGQIAAIIFGGVVGLGIFLGCLMCALNRIRKQTTKEDTTPPTQPSVSCISPQMANVEVSEEGYFNDGFHFGENHPHYNNELPPSYDEVMGRLNQCTDNQNSLHKQAV